MGVVWFLLKLAISIVVQVKHDLPGALDTVKEFAALNGGKGVVAPDSVLVRTYKNTGLSSLAGKSPHQKSRVQPHLQHWAE